MLQKLDNQGFTFTDDGKVIVVDKYGAVKRLTNLTLTTIGTSGPATLIGNVLNIPDYTEMFFGTVTSVGLSMPAAFTVTNSPVTTAGTLTVTAAGLVSQYVRGDGTLADFPGSTGGGSSVAYYLNGSVNQGVFGGNAYYQMSRTPVVGAGTNFSIAANGYIASFITDANDPSLISIPSGGWNIQFYMSANLAGGAPNFYVELYKYDGVSFTLISTGSATPENITGGTSIDLYYTSISVPTTALTVTDRLAVRVYVNNSGRTITLYTEGTNLAEIVTTFTTGLTAMNGLTAQVQYLTTGTSGTDFNISSATATHTFNLPVASALNTGKLSNTDWVTFNAKQDALSLTTTGSSGASTLIGSTLNVPAYTLSGLGGVPTSRTLTVNGTAYDLSADRSWSVGTVTSVAATAGTGISISGSPITGSGTLNITNTAPDQIVSLTSGTGISVSGTYPNFTITNSSPSPAGAITGSGTTNYLSKWTSSSALGNSLVFDNGTSVGVNTATPSASYRLDVVGAGNFSGGVNVTGSGTLVNEFRSNGIIAIDMTPNLTDDYKFRTLVAVSGDVTQTAINNISINSGGFFGFGGGGSEKMRLTSAGRLLIGTTTESTYELDVVGDIRSTLDANINGLTVGKGGGSVATNTAFGYQAINGSATGTANAALGYQSLQNLTSGPRNVGLGYRVLRSITTGQNNTGVGSNYVGDGSSPLFSVTTGSYNTALGSGALYSASTTSENTAVGYGALGLTTASFVTAVGSLAGYNSTGNGGIFVGRLAGLDVTTGTYNTIIGSGTTGNGITTGSFNTIIGSQITGLSASLSNTIILADGQGNQRLYINSSGNVGVGTTSPQAGYRFTSNGGIYTTAGSVFFDNLDITNSGYSLRADIYQSTNLAQRFQTAVTGVTLNGFSLYNTTFEAYRNLASYSASFTVGTRGVTASNANPTYSFGINPTFGVGNGYFGGITAWNGTAVQNLITFFPSTFNVGIGLSSQTDAGYKLDVNGTFRADNIILQTSGGYREIRTSLAAGLRIINSAGPLWLEPSSHVLVFSPIRAASSGLPLQYILLNNGESINTNNGYGYNWGLNIGADGTSVMQIFTGGNVLFQKSVTKTSTNQASALIEMVSTTQGFLPPRMTGAQAEAIATPAAGLMVYANNGNGTTITSTGWWGYNGTTWVKLN